MPELVTVITGASSGIGAALARQLSSRKHKLVLAARRLDELRLLSSQTGVEALCVVTDVTRRSDVDHLRDLALEEYGQVDVWVNNAGRGITRQVMELTDQEFDEIVEVVLKSVFYGMQAIIPHFQDRGRGHLVNVSSFLGRVPLLPYRSIYSASKSAVNTLTACLRMDLRSKYPGIHVSTLMPGIVDTDFHKIAGPGLSVRAGGNLGPTRVESAEEVAGKIVSLLDNPQPELYTSSSQAELVKQYFEDVGKFEERMARRASGSS
jgi:short-subunit dehydrogenase